MKADVIPNKYPKTGRAITEANLITRYPMAAFFSFTLLLSWSIWFLAPVMSGKDRFSLGFVILILLVIKDKMWEHKFSLPRMV